MDRLNADELQSVSSVLDFFGDNLQQDDNVTPILDNPTESFNSNVKEKKKFKRRRNSSKDVGEEETHQAKRSKLKASTIICLIGCGNIRGLLYQVMMMRTANRMSVIQMTMVMKRLLLCYQATPH